MVSGDNWEPCRHESEAYGTGVVGHLPNPTTFTRLVEVLGEPHTIGSPDNKTQVQWNLEFEDGTIATVYDYKERKPPEKVTDWHVGGFGVAALEYVKELLAGQQKRGNAGEAEERDVVNPEPAPHDNGDLWRCFGDAVGQMDGGIAPYATVDDLVAVVLANPEVVLRALGGEHVRGWSSHQRDAWTVPVAR